MKTLTRITSLLVMLSLLAGGADAQSALDRLVADDDGRDQRQAGIVDAHGGSATFTGSGCFEWAGGRTGPSYAAQGNILAGPQVVDALADTFTATEGPLAERLLAALAAADAAGGDRRGRQSACVIVRRTGGGYGGTNDILIDLRVDDHADPVGELQRIYAIHDLLFGQTPEDRMIPLEEVGAEVTERLAKLGFDGPVDEALRAWAGRENLEERLREGRITGQPGVLSTRGARVSLGVPDGAELNVDGEVIPAFSPITVAPGHFEVVVP